MWLFTLSSSLTQIVHVFMCVCALDIHHMNWTWIHIATGRIFENTNIIQCQYLVLLLLTVARIIVLVAIVIFGVLHIIRKSNSVYKHLFFLLRFFLRKILCWCLHYYCCCNHARVLIKHQLWFAIQNNMTKVNLKATCRINFIHHYMLIKIAKIYIVSKIKHITQSFWNVFFYCFCHFFA